MQAVILTYLLQKGHLIVAMAVAGFILYIRQNATQRKILNSVKNQPRSARAQNGMLQRLVRMETKLDGMSDDIKRVEDKMNSVEHH